MVESLRIANEPMTSMPTASWPFHSPEPSVTLLRDESYDEQGLEMMRESRWGHTEAALQLADGQARVAGLDQRPVDAEPGWIAQSFEAGCSIFDLHGKWLAFRRVEVNGISNMLEAW